MIYSPDFRQAVSRAFSGRENAAEIGRLLENGDERLGSVLDGELYAQWCELCDDQISAL